MTSQNFILIVIVLLVIWCWSRSKTVKIESEDGRQWNVVGAYSNSTEAANLISKVHKEMIEFMRKLKLKYQIDKVGHDVNINSRKHQLVSALLNNYNPETFYENDPAASAETSYTINKGESMHICLRNKENPNKLVSPEVMKFVMLHEMAHIANFDGWGHDAQYWSVFKFILEEAVAAGAIEPVDFSKKPIKYCGLLLNHNPLYDDTIDKII